MQRTIRLQIHPNEEQKQALIESMDLYALCYNYVAKHGFENHDTNGVSLHHATYYPLRELYPNLPSEFIITSRMKATESLKSIRASLKKGRKVSCPVMSHKSVRLDARTYALKKDFVSMSSTIGRLHIPFSSNKHAYKWLELSNDTTYAELLIRNGKFYVYASIKIPDKVFEPSGKVVGIDVGINRPAVTSEHQFYGERRWKEVDKRYFRLKRKLQAKGTKSAKKHLKKLSGKVQRFRRDCDHVISRKIVDSIEIGTVIAVEKLTGIVKNTKQRGAINRRRMHSWSFAQLQSFIDYKSEDKGCLMVHIDPRYTSQTCSKCGHVDKKNRKSQSVFLCKNCGYELNADLNAAINIAAKYHVEDGKSVFDGPLSTGLMPQPLFG